MKTLNVAHRFRGPPASANGGYFAGRVAGLASSTVTVRLLKPPPLEVDMEVLELADGALEIRHEAQLIASAQPAVLTLQPPLPVTYLEAVEFSRAYPGFDHHPYVTCFVCGPQRARGDGLRVFAGPVPGRDVAAAPWVPDASLDRGDGKVRPEFMAAALDCPGYYAVTPEGRRPMLLAELTAHVDRLVHIDESCTIMGWRIAANGRKHEAGTALFDEDGELCGLARALWIEPKYDGLQHGPVAWPACSG